MIKVIFFDVGGTLIAPYPSVGAIYSRVAARHGIDATAEELNLRFRDAWRQHKGKRTLVDREWWRRVVGDVLNEPTAELFDDLYAEFEKKDVWNVYPDVEKTLEALQNRNIRLAVASNWDERLPSLLKSLQLDRFFEKQFISFQLKYVKPDVRFFEQALTSMNVDPLETLHVGDNWEEDIEGAQRAGIRAYQIDRLHKAKNSRALSSLDEVLLRI